MLAILSYIPSVVDNYIFLALDELCKNIINQKAAFHILLILCYMIIAIILIGEMEYGQLNYYFRTTDFDLMECCQWSITCKI